MTAVAVTVNAGTARRKCRGRKPRTMRATRMRPLPVSAMRVPPAMRTPTNASTATVATSSTDTPIGSHAVKEVVRRRVLVEGLVQGVWYRASAEREAVRLNLAGLARNLNDGRVEMIVEGPVAAVDAFIAWARIGPPRAHVTGIEIEGQPPTGQLGFRVR